MTVTEDIKQAVGLADGQPASAYINNHTPLPHRIVLALTFNDYRGHSRRDE